MGQDREFPIDRGERVSAHRSGAGAKIAFLNEFAQDLVVCLIIPGKLLLPQPKFRSFASLVCCSLGAAQPFFSCYTAVTRAQFNAID